MKRGFTLVEMLIVVAVLVTLMTITFRLSSIGGDSTARNVTISRMQRLENCLSGYYAAFGTYPPVKLHGNRNIYLRLSNNRLAVQNTDGDENQSIWGWYTDSGNHGIGTTQEEEAWRQVHAACVAQPVACSFPWPKNYNNVIKAQSDIFKRYAESGETRYKSYWNNQETREVFTAGFDDGYTDNPGRHDLTKSEWRDTQLFQFGLMSYLLPRYMVMMNGDEMFFSTSCKQWSNNNELPCDPLQGSKFGSWSTVRNYASDTKNANNLAKVQSIPSQAVCARWMPNLEGCCLCNHTYKLFGINIRYTDSNGSDSAFDRGAKLEDCIYGESGDRYILDTITVTDGWKNDFYYYSPAPYQTYTIWSAGKNGRTFPPWISREGMDANANRCIGVWVADDLMHLSN